MGGFRAALFVVTQTVSLRRRCGPAAEKLRRIHEVSRKELLVRVVSSAFADRLFFDCK
jgi:hypothetical protein